MKKIQDNAGLFFIACVALLGGVSVAGVWELLSNDVIGKSMQTVGLLAITAFVIIAAGRVIDHRKRAVEGVAGSDGDQIVPLDVHPAFIRIRHLTVVILIAVVSILALVGVLSIWDVVGGEVLLKSFSSMAIVIFSSVVMVLTCLEREGHQILHRKMSGWSAVVVIIFAYLFLSSFIGML